MQTTTMLVTTPFPIAIGYSGEHNVDAVIFDFSPWAEQFGTGVLTLILNRPTDAEPYPIALEAVAGSETQVMWTITNTDTAMTGVGQAQLMYSVDNQIRKSCCFDVYVGKSITGSVDPGDPYQTWLEKMIAERIEAEQAAEESAGSAENAAASAKEAADTLASKVTGPGMTLFVQDGIVRLNVN